MKKLMFAVAALAAGVACAEITSANIVGYTTHESVSLGAASIGAVFTPMTTDGQWTCVDKIYDSTATIGDTVMFLNPTIFDLDAYSFNGYDKDGNPQGWTYMTSDPETGDPLDDQIATFKLGKGSVSYCSPADGQSSFTVAGQVADITKAVVVTLDPGDVGICEIVNPFPQATKLSDLESFCSIGDTVMVLNLEIFDLDAYSYNGEGQGWTYMTSDPETGDPIDEQVDSSAIVLPVGQGGYFTAADGEVRTWTVTL